VIARGHINVDGEHTNGDGNCNDDDNSDNVKSTTRENSDLCLLCRNGVSFRFIFIFLNQRWGTKNEKKRVEQQRREVAVREEREAAVDGGGGDRNQDGGVKRNCEHWCCLGFNFFIIETCSA